MAELVIKLVNGELAGKTMQELQKNTTAAALAVKKAEIGTQKWVDAHKKLEDAKKLQADLKKQIEGTTKASDLLKQAWTTLPGSQYFDQVVSSFGMMKQAVGGLVSQFGVLKTALLATGLGALVIALGSIVTWMKKTDEGAVFLEGKMRGLSGTVDVLLGRFANLGKTNFFKNILRDIEEAIMLGDVLANVYDTLDDKRRDVELGTAQTETAVNQLLLQSKNIALTYEQRLNFLDQAEEKELADYALRKKLNQDFIAWQKVENAASERNGTLSDKQKDKLNELLIEQQKIANESITLQEKITNRRSQLLEKQENEELRALEERRKREEDAAKKRQAALDKQKMEELNAIKTIEDARIAIMDEGADKEIARIELDTKRKIEAVKGGDELEAQQLLLFIGIKKQQIAAVKKKYADADAAKDEKDKKAEADRRKTAMDKELDDIQRQADHKNFLLLEQLSEGQITRRQFDELAEQNQIKAWEDQLVALEEQGQKESALYEQIAGKIIDVELQKEEKIKQSRQQTFNAAVALGNAIFQSQIANIDRENAAGEKRLAAIEARSGKESAAYKTAQAQLIAEQRKNFEKKKKIEKSQIKINALAEIAGIIKSAVEIGGIYGLIVGALLSAATLVRANSAIKQVDAQQFADGGYVSGPSHAQGGIPGVVKGSRRPVEFEGGEFFFSKKAVAAIGVDNLSRLNNHYTQKFAAGGPVNPFVNRAPVASSASSQQQASAQSDNALLANKIDQLVAAQNARIDRIKVINNVGDTDEGIKTLNTIKGNADV